MGYAITADNTNVFNRGGVSTQFQLYDNYGLSTSELVSQIHLQMNGQWSNIFLNILLESQLHLDLQFVRLRWTIRLKRGHGKLDPLSNIPSDSTGRTCAHQLLGWRNTTKDGCILLATWHHDGEEQGPHNGPHQRISWVCINSGATHDRWVPACPTSAAPTSRWRGGADNRWCADGRNTGRANIWQQVRKGNQKGMRLV